MNDLNKHETVSEQIAEKGGDARVEGVGELHELDAAGKFLADMAASPDGDHLTSPYTEAESAAVRRKADLIICPLLFWALSMGAVDKVALGTAGVLGIRKDLELVGQQFSWASSLIFFGQLVSVFPALFLMQRFQTGQVIGLNVVTWGVISMCIAACSNFAGLASCRFLLGFFESLTFPGFSLVIGSWYTRKEQVIRIAIIFSTLSSFTNGIISFGVSHVSASVIAPWRLLFVIVGGITFLIGILMVVYLPNSPMTAWWLTPRQRCIAVMRVQENRTGVASREVKAYQVKEALLDPKTYLVFLANVGLNIPNGGTATFSSIIINGFGFNVRQTMLLQIPTGLFSWAGSLILSYIAAKTQQRTLTALGGAFLPLIGTIMLHTIPRSNRAASMVGLYIVYLYWAPYVLMNAQHVANSAGGTKKIVSYGVVYMGYLVGNLIGPQTFKASQAPRYSGGIVAMLVGYCCAIGMIALYYINIRILRAKKAKKLATAPPVGEEDELLAEWHDLTDFENDKFQYHL